ASSTATSSFTVAKQTPTVGLSLGPDPVSAGSTLTATVTVGTTGTVSPPTGTITVSTDGSESGCTVPATGGSCDLSLTVTGARTLSASYAGDDNFNGDSDSASVTVDAATTTARIDTISPAAPVVGEAIAIGFSLSGGVAPYSGAVSVLIDPTPADTGNGDAFACPGLLFDANTGTGSCSLVAGLADAGVYGLSLDYAGDGNEGPGSDTDSVTVSAASASLSLSSGGSSVVGQAVSVNALVSRLAPATGSAEGSVQITATGPAPSLATQVCDIAALAGGAGSCGFTFTEVGSYSLSASYTSADGNTQSIAGPAGTILHSVERALATISLDSVLPASPRVGQSTTVSFSVAGGFGGNDGLVDISTSSSGGAGPGCSGLAASAGSCVLSFATAGSYTVTATYNASGSDGDDSIGATDVLVGLTVQPAEGGLDVGVSDTTPEAGQPVTISASVQTVGGTPATGTITVSRSGSPVCTITLPATSCEASFGSIGSAPLDFAYSGDANYAPASTSVPLTVSPAATTLAITGVSPTSLLAGQSSTVSYTVSGGFAGNTGTVLVTASSGSNTATCSAPAAAGSCAIALARAGVWSFAATYNAGGSDVDDAASSASSATPVSVTRTPTVTALTVDPAAGGPFGTTVTLSAQVDRNAPGVGQPQGMVTFLVDGASIGEAPLSPSGQAVFSTSTLPVGSRVLRAQYNGNDDYLVSFDEKTFEVSRKAVTLAITGSSVNPSAIAESVVFSYSFSTAPGTTPTGNITLTASTGESCVGTIAAGQCAISFTTGGNRSLSASYAGDALHAAASSAAFAHSVAGTPTTLVFAAGNPVSATFGDLVSIATELSGGTAPNDGLVSVTASAAGQTSVSCSAAVVGGASSCSLAGLGAGTWSVSASYAGDSDDAGSNTPAPLSLLINPASQTIVFGTAPSLVFDGPAGTLSATGGASGNPIVFSSTTPSVCSVVGDQVSPLAAGACIVAANQAGSANYSAAAEVTQTIEVAQASQTIVFGPAPSLVFNGPAGTLSATGGASGNPVVFGSSTPSVCSVVGTQVTPLAVGSCIVTANQAGNANYAAAAEATQTLVIGNGSQTITFGPNPGPLSFGGPVAQVSATASSGLPVSFGTRSPEVCTISGTGPSTASLTILAAGTCVVTADQAGDGSFNAAPQETQSVQIDRASQTITFAAIADAVAGSGAITLNATADSGLSVSFGTPSSASVCTVDSGAGTVTPVGPGSCVVEATQAGNGNYLPATPVSRSFTVTAAQVDLSMLKTGRYLAGGLIQWNLAIGNTGPGAATAATVLDSLPAAVTGATWTCAASVGSSCAAASGTGDINTTVNVAAGGSVVIEITATLVDPNASTVVNSASVQPAAGVIDTNPGNNVSTLDLRVALFSDGFESAAVPGGLLKALDSLSMDGAAVESKLRGAEPVDIGYYVGEGKALRLQAREVHGLVEVRLLQKTQAQPWARSRWIELWPGDRVHLDYVNTGPQLEAQVAVGQ
ncbi:beta strand repeat-containing protein, partial [Aquimonas voraii]